MNPQQAKIKQWREQPHVMVRELFGAEPDPWQDEVLRSFPTTPRIAMKASKGPGKSTVLAWLAWNFLLTRPHPNIAATSISGDNLRDGLWKEMATWMSKSELLKQMFTWQTERIFAKEAPATWFMSARSWSKSADPSMLGNTLAGLHSDYIMFVIDESGSIPIPITISAEAALASCKEGHILQAGNTNRLDGALYDACVTRKHLWKAIQITGDPENPMRSPRVSLDWAREMISTYGRDSPFVKVMVLGEWPAASINSLLGPEDIEAAMARKYQQHHIDHAARVLGVDVARFGDDCFDAITEILTDDGWKLFSDLRGDERVLSMESDKASWEPIDKIHQYDFDGELNLFEKRHLNFCVTDKHRFLVRANPKSKKYRFRAWKELPLEFIVRGENGWSGTSPESITFTARDAMYHGGVRIKTWTFAYQDWAALLGWFVSEGNVYRELRKNGRLRTCIAQLPGPKRDALEALLTRMGLKWRATGQGRQVEFSSAQIGQWLITECMQGAHNKRVPKSIRDGSPETIRSFLDAFLLGDGTQRADGTGRMYYTSSKLLADDLQEMMAKLGVAGALRLKERAGSTFEIDGRMAVRNHDTYVLYERFGIGTFGKTVNKRHANRVRYTGKIWCVSTRFQSIYVRRKGVPMWSGNSSVIFPRQGLVAFPPKVLRNVDGNVGAGQVARVWEDWKVDAVFIDNTGGYGASWIDQLKNLNRNAIPIGFADSAIDPRYYNRRSEMYFKMADWIKGGGCLPNVPELVAELTQTTYTFKGDRLIIEPKDIIKVRLGRSPDLADSLALTHAEPVASRAQQIVLPQRQADTEYDPFQSYMRG